jgi:hypothetical protein
MPATAARRTSIIRTAGGGAPIVLVSPTRKPSRASRVGARIGSAAARAAVAEKHTLAALLAAGIAGAARRYDWKLPTLGDLPPPLVWGLGSWAVGRFTNNKMASHIATGLLSVGLYEQVAYTKSTRDQIDALLATQRATEEAAESSEGPGVFGDFGG